MTVPFGLKMVPVTTRPAAPTVKELVRVIAAGKGWADVGVVIILVPAGKVSGTLMRSLLRSLEPAASTAPDAVTV